MKLSDFIFQPSKVAVNMASALHVAYDVVFFIMTLIVKSREMVINRKEPEEPALKKNY